jgi:deazaflavin-dependent oxidoreductase (nitroreductase family)
VRTAQITHAGSRTGWFARRWSMLHARLYRRTGGRFMPNWFGAPVMVLETVGRNSGKRRATPVLHMRDGERLVVMASNAGHHRAPAWWLNLRDAGEGVAVIAGERMAVRPRVPEGEERERLWEGFKRMYPAAEEYLDFTDREIPLIVLEPS